MNHLENMSRLNRISGQVEGIKKMVSDERYCIDILNQIRAVRSALKAVERNILNKHLIHCVAQSLNNPKEAQQKLEELKKLFNHTDD